MPASRPRARRAAPDGGPVVQVVIDSPLPHLDRVFDYRLPPDAEQVTAGWRVRVRFSGRLVDAYVLARIEQSEHLGDIRPIERPVGVEPVLTAATLALVGEVADRWAGTTSDVIRAAVPPRHARAEGTTVEPCTWRPGEDPDGPQRWAAYDAGPALLDRIGRGGTGTRAAWSAAPATSWARDAGGLVTAALAGTTGGVIVVVPDAADVERVLAALPEARAAGAVAVLTADMGPERRYREFVRILRGGARVVVGTRAAVFAPVADLGLIVVWDDGDDALCDPQAPYWDARDVAALRSHLSGCDLVVGSPARSVITQQWCRSGWAHSVSPSRAVVSARGPRVRALVGDDAARDPAAAAARIPHAAWQAAREALATGPVLVQVARRGYLPAVACQACRAIARCGCGGPLELHAGERVAQCAWCGARAPEWACAACGGRRLRAVSVGAERTAEEIGRAFPGVPVLASRAGHIIPHVPAAPAVVVATPGAEPEAEEGYRAVLLLDARALLQRPFLDAEEDALRRWFAAARLAGPGARVVVVAPNAARPVQALARWDAAWGADRELDERVAAGLPPAVRLAAVTGAHEDVLAVVAMLAVPHAVLGPVPYRPAGRSGSAAPDDPAAEVARALVRVDRERGRELSHELRAVIATRSAQSRGRVVHVRLDPRDM